MLKAREQHGVSALTGGFQPASMETPAERYYEYRMRLLFADKPKPVSAAPMMNLLVERSAFEAVGGFSDLPLPAMEDWELCYRLSRGGHPLFYDPAVAVVHAYGDDWRYVVKRGSQVELARADDLAHLGLKPVAQAGQGHRPLPRCAAVVLPILPDPALPRGRGARGRLLLPSHLRSSPHAGWSAACAPLRRAAAPEIVPRAWPTRQRR